MALFYFLQNSDNRWWYLKINISSSNLHLRRYRLCIILLILSAFLMFLTHILQIQEYIYLSKNRIFKRTMSPYCLCIDNKQCYCNCKYLPNNLKEVCNFSLLVPLSVHSRSRKHSLNASKSKNVFCSAIASIIFKIMFRLMIYRLQENAHKFDTLRSTGWKF